MKYTIHSDADGYSGLRGPEGFECWLTEPKYRTWRRDGKPVVDKLNEYADLLEERDREINRLRAELLSTYEERP